MSKSYLTNTFFKKYNELSYFGALSCFCNKIIKLNNLNIITLLSFLSVLIIILVIIHKFSFLEKLEIIICSITVVFILLPSLGILFHSLGMIQLGITPLYCNGCGCKAVQFPATWMLVPSNSRGRGLLNLTVDLHNLNLLLSLKKVPWKRRPLFIREFCPGGLNNDVLE